MIYNVITPLNRVENIEKMISILEPKNVNWHVVTDDTFPHNDEFKKYEKNWIHHYIMKNNKHMYFWERCNAAMNWLLDTMEINNGEMYCFLNDDDAVEPDYFKKITTNLNHIKKDKGIDFDIIITSMDRGDAIPTDAEAGRRHPPTRLTASVDNLKIGSIGLEQITISGKLLNSKKYKFPLEHAGDGMFILTAIRENTQSVVLMPDVSVWFNYFEPGRWIK